MTSSRLANASPAKPLRFTFDGRSYEGREGDTIASALLANGIRIVGRSFKYHRPRGIFGAGHEEPNAIVDVTRDGLTTPNLRATTEFLTEGMAVRSVNASPSAEADRYGVIDRVARFLPAGFYYKTFLWPDWHRFEPRIRSMAGLGRLDPAHEPPADCDIVNARCDVLVVGAGPAGLAAAQSGARGGRRVILVDDRPVPGGSLLWCDARIDDRDATDWAGDAVLRVEREGGRVLARTTAYGIYDHNLVCCWERRAGLPDRQWRIRAKHIVVAAGAIERPLVFPDNDRPGIMSAEAALFYLKRHDVLVGRRVVLATNNDRAWSVADALAEAGVQVTIADLRKETSASAGDGIEILHGAAIDGVAGRNGVEAVILNGRRVEADCLLVSGGFTPSVHLFCQAKGKLRYDERIVSFVPGDPVEGITVAGAANGGFVLEAGLEEGHAAGGGEGDPPRSDCGRDSFAIQPSWPSQGMEGRQWIDFQNDVTLKDVELAARENFRSVEHLKRYTTLGMATDQGKTSNMNGLAAMAAITGRTIEETGTTTYRPPFVPVPFTVIAGRRRGELFNPMRRLALERQHRAAGAVFREYGGWLRPAYYGSGEAAAEIRREARQARETVAIFDGSPLGKIEVLGPQAGEVVDFNSYQTISTLKPGRIRYGFMLTESGVIYDDGVTMKLADDHYVVSCSSGHVGGVVLRLEEWRQDRLDPSRSAVHNLTPHWSTLTATGPGAKRLVEALSLGVDLDDAKLPHMAVAAGTFANRPARVARVSFTGDRSYEISVRASHAPALWEAMNEAGRELDAFPMGSEALLLLRAEKGFIVAGKDTDGTTMPHDLGLTGPRDKRQGEYAGKRSLFTENALRDDRPQFVGLDVREDEPALTTGAHGVETAGGRRRSNGFVTSSYGSPVLGRPIALGLIERGIARMGEEIDIFHLGATRRARIVSPCFLDPEGNRLND